MLTSIINFTNIKHFLIIFHTFNFMIYFCNRFERRNIIASALKSVENLSIDGEIDLINFVNVIEKEFLKITTTNDDVNDFLTTTSSLLKKTAKGFSTTKSFCKRTTIFCSTIIADDFRLLSTATKDFCKRTTIFCLSTIIVDDFRSLSATATKDFCKRTTIFCSTMIVDNFRLLSTATAKNFCERVITIIF